MTTKRRPAPTPTQDEPSSSPPVDSGGDRALVAKLTQEDYEAGRRHPMALTELERDLILAQRAGSSDGSLPRMPLEGWLTTMSTHGRGSRLVFIGVDPTHPRMLPDIAIATARAAMVRAHPDTVPDDWFTSAGIVHLTIEVGGGDPYVLSSVPNAALPRID